MSFSFGSMPCLVDKGLLTPIAIAFRSSLVVGQINKIQPPQSGTPLRLLQIWSRTELDGTKYCYQLILIIEISEKSKVD